MNYQGSTCVCRVPKAQLREGTVVECVHCGASDRAPGVVLPLKQQQAAAGAVPTLEALVRP
jgi:hypothetical protein